MWFAAWATLCVERETGLVQMVLPDSVGPCDTESVMTGTRFSRVRLQTCCMIFVKIMLHTPRYRLHVPFSEWMASNHFLFMRIINCLFYIELDCFSMICETYQVMKNMPTVRKLISRLPRPRTSSGQNFM